MTTVDERTQDRPATPPRTPLLRARNLVQEFPVRGAGGIKGGDVHAVSNVSFDMLARVRRSAWWGRPGRASPPWPVR